MNLNTKIARMSKVRKVDGQVGIEIECEVRNEMTNPWHSNFWQLQRDGSLRGVGYEFVLARPIPPRDIDTALKEWRTLCDSHRVRFVDSKRTSVHVHCNVQDYTILQVINIICAYWLCEPLLLNLCGEERKGNLFCLDLSSADTVHTHLIKNLKDRKFFQGFAKDVFRYASLNIEALYKFGSLEFRIMRGTQDISLISNWAKELHYLVTNAAKAKSPHDFLALIKEGKHKKFLRRLFTESFTDDLIKTTGHSWRDVINSRSMYIMDILHARDVWDPIQDEKDEKKHLELNKKNISAMRWPVEDPNGEVHDFAPLVALGPNGWPMSQGREGGDTLNEAYRDEQGVYAATYYWNCADWIPLERNSPRLRNVHNHRLTDFSFEDISRFYIEGTIANHFGPFEEPMRRTRAPNFRTFGDNPVTFNDLRQAVEAQPAEIVGLNPRERIVPIIDDVAPVVNDPGWWAREFNEIQQRRAREEAIRPPRNIDEP